MVMSTRGCEYVCTLRVQFHAFLTEMEVTALLRAPPYLTRGILNLLRPKGDCRVNPYPTAFPYGNGMVLHFYQQQESSTTKTVHKVINKGLKTYV